jgi:hypothetical protein
VLEQPHSGHDVLNVLRRQAEVVAMGPQKSRVTVGMLTVSPAVSDDPGSHADRGGVIRRWDVSVKPAMGPGGKYIIQSIVIKDRPKNPDTSGMQEQGGKSFHHESAWAFIEKQITQFEGHPLDEVVAHLVKYGIGGMWPSMKDPGANSMDQLMQLNGYFHEFLTAQASAAQGWLGPTGTHAAQGGKISAAIKKLSASGWTTVNVFAALDVSFEPDPRLAGAMLWQAAQAHADTFYGAFQHYLEAEGAGAAISPAQHDAVLEWIKDWDTKYWKPEFDPMDENHS